MSCLIEAGEEYSDLRGVLVYGVARRIDDPEGVLDVGMNVTRRMAGMPDAEELLHGVCRPTPAENGSPSWSSRVE